MLPSWKKFSKCNLAAHPWCSHFWNQGGLNQNHNTQFTNSCWCTHCKKLFLEFRILCCSYLFKEICLEMIKSGLTLLLQIKVIIQVAMQSSICSTNGDFLQSYAQKNETFFGICSKNVFICENMRFKKNDAWIC